MSAVSSNTSLGQPQDRLPITASFHAPYESREARGILPESS